jgi:hypothetical protein
MAENEMFQNIMAQAQEYASGIRAEAGATPAAPAPYTMSMDISGLQGINNTLAQGGRNAKMVQGGVGQAKNQYGWEEEEKKRAAAEAARAYAEQKAKKAVRVPKDDGGYDFFDGDGKPISALQFAQLNDTDVVSVLKDSMNPDDAKLVSDYENMREFWDAAQRVGGMGKVDINNYKVEDDGEGGQVLLDENDNQISSEDPRYVYYSYIKQNPEIEKMSLDQTRRAFMKKYSRAFFSPGQKG